MATKKTGGKPGPLLVFGVPLIILAAGIFLVVKLIGGKGSGASTEDGGKASGPTASKCDKKIKIRVAGDPWSGYSTFRDEPKLAAKLAKFDMCIEYKEMLDQSDRMKALGAGEIDLAVTTLDAFLQHGAKNKVGGQYPGVIVWNIDESAGGDAIFLSKDRKSFDDIKPSDKVCFAVGTPSEHLWDFTSLSFSHLGDNVTTDNKTADGKDVDDAKICWEKLKEGKVQIAVLWQPYTALAEKDGYKKVFATGGQADDVIIDIAVANRDFAVKQKDTLNKLARAYFDTIDSYMHDTEAHAQFITDDCGEVCNKDIKLGKSVLGGIEFLTYDANMCLWWGQCGKPAKEGERVGKTGRLLLAKGKVEASALPQPSAILNDSFLLALKGERDSSDSLKKDQGVAVAPKPVEKTYDYKAEQAATSVAADVGTLTLPNVFFASGSYVLDQNGLSVVGNIADKLKDLPALCVKINGYTSSEGDRSSNVSLSAQRAESIKKRLTEIDGIAFKPARFVVKGFGPDQLVMKAGAEDRNASRRTEFKVFNCVGN